MKRKIIDSVIGRRFQANGTPIVDRYWLSQQGTSHRAQNTVQIFSDQKASTYLGATAAFPARPLATIAVLAKAPLWVKALAEHDMETAKATANKNLLANMVNE